MNGVLRYGKCICEEFVPFVVISMASAYVRDAVDDSTSLILALKMHKDCRIRIKARLKRASCRPLMAGRSAVPPRKPEHNDNSHADVQCFRGVLRDGRVRVRQLVPRRCGAPVDVVMCCDDEDAAVGPLLCATAEVKRTTAQWRVPLRLRGLLLLVQFVPVLVRFDIYTARTTHAAATIAENLSRATAAAAASSATAVSTADIN